MFSLHHIPFLSLPSIKAGPSLITSFTTIWPSVSAMVIPRPWAGSLRSLTSMLSAAGGGGVVSCALVPWSLPAGMERVMEGHG